MIEHFDTDPTGAWSIPAGFLSPPALVKSGQLYPRSRVLLPDAPEEFAQWITTGDDPVPVGPVDIQPVDFVQWPSPVTVQIKGSGEPGLTLALVRVREAVDTTVFTWDDTLDLPLHEVTLDIANGDELRLDVVDNTVAATVILVELQMRRTVAELCYVTPDEVTVPGRVGIKARFAPKLAGQNPTYYPGDVVAVGIAHTDFSQATLCYVDSTTLYVFTPGATLEAVAHGVDFSAGGEWWFTLDAADVLTFTGGIWTSEPIPGVEAPISLTAVSPSPFDLPAHPVLNATGTAHPENGGVLVFSDDDIEDEDTAYDDFFATGVEAVVALPEVVLGQPRTGFVPLG